MVRTAAVLTVSSQSSPLVQRAGTAPGTRDPRCGEQSGTFARLSVEHMGATELLSPRPPKVH